MLGEDVCSFIFRDFPFLSLQKQLLRELLLEKLLLLSKLLQLLLRLLLVDGLNSLPPLHCTAASPSLQHPATP